MISSFPSSSQTVDKIAAEDESLKMQQSFNFLKIIKETLETFNMGGKGRALRTSYIRYMNIYVYIRKGKREIKCKINQTRKFLYILCNGF